MDVSMVLAIALLIGVRADLGAARYKRSDLPRSIRASVSSNDIAGMGPAMQSLPQSYRRQGRS